MATSKPAAGPLPDRSPHFWMAPVLIALALIPIEFEIAGLLLNGVRLLLLFTTPYLGVLWISGKFGRWTYSDYAITFFCVWMTLSIAYHDPARVFGFAGSNVLQVIGAYLIGRAAIRSADDFLSMTRYLALATIVLVPLGFYESVFHKHSLILEWLAQFDALQSHSSRDMCCRIGLNRAQTVLIHPIHYGILSSMAISGYFLGLANREPLGKRVFVVLLLIAGTTFSVSSGALIAMGLQLLLIGYAVALHSVPAQWQLARWGGVAAYIVLELNTTKFAFFTLAEKLAFSAHNAWTRQIMIRTGLELVERYPLFGYGLRNWPLPFWMRYSNSIDNYWLILAGSYGLPTFLSAFSAFIVPMFTLGGKRLTKGSDLYYVRLSWTFLMIAVVIAIATVHLWDVLTTLVYMALGSGMFLAYATEPVAADGQAAPEPDRPRHRYTRFPGGAGPVPGSARAVPGGAGMADRTGRRTASARTRSAVARR